MTDIGERRYQMGKDRKHQQRLMIYVFCNKCAHSRWVRYIAGRNPDAWPCLPCATNKIGKGPECPAWKGGQCKTRDGYIKIRIYEGDFFYPMAQEDGYVLEHRLVVARALQRCLLPWEVVHHKEGCAKDDNRFPQTLDLLPSPHIHTAITHILTYVKRMEKQNQQLRLRCLTLEKELSHANSNTGSCSK